MASPTITSDWERRRGNLIAVYRVDPVVVPAAPVIDDVFAELVWAAACIPDIPGNTSQYEIGQPLDRKPYICRTLAGGNKTLSFS